jgi:citrate lyase subunit beta / citryl-CoA lyase
VTDLLPDPSNDAARADDLRPRRSVLYMPGANERALEKATGLPADALILDLEDAVAPDAKAEARDRVCAAAAEGRYGHREVAIRANGLDTGWFDDDVAAVAAAGPDALLVPKVNTVEDVHTIEAALEKGGAPDRTRIWAMLETPAAVLNAGDICVASERLAVFVMGTNDLVKELRARRVPGRHPLLPSLAWCVMAARAAGKVIVDGVYNDLYDADGFAAECQQGRELGFDGKTLIHPKQLEACNRIYAPSDAEVAAAQEIIEAFDAAEREGRGVVTVRGRLIEHLHVEEARRTLAQAEAIAALVD